jgi:uncharacterized protein
LRAGGNCDFRGTGQTLGLPLLAQACHPERRSSPRRTYVLAASADAASRLHRSFASLRMTSSSSVNMFAINENPERVSFAVKIHPRAKKNAITGEVGDALKVSLTAPPVEGRANEACIEFFAKLLKVPRSSVTIASGQSSRNKVIRVAGLSAAELRTRLRQ